MLKQCDAAEARIIKEINNPWSIEHKIIQEERNECIDSGDKQKPPHVNLNAQNARQELDAFDCYQMASYVLLFMKDK